MTAPKPLPVWGPLATDARGETPETVGPAGAVHPSGRVGELIRILADPPADADLLALRAELGLGWLAIYERDGDEAAHAAGLACLHAAVAQAPTHPLWGRWVRWLGLGYAERGRRQHSLADYHKAVDWLATLYASLPAADRTTAAATLLEVCWERFWLVRFGQPEDTVDGLAESDRLLDRVVPMLAGEGVAEALRDARLIAGLAHLERYEFSRKRRDLDRGIDLLAAGSLWDLPSGTPSICQLGSELANALRRRAILDDDPGSLDRAIAAGKRTIERSSPADGSAWLMLHFYQAMAYEQRLRGHRDSTDVDCHSTDVDGAVACWRVLSEAGDQGV